MDDNNHACLNQTRIIIYNTDLNANTVSLYMDVCVDVISRFVYFDVFVGQLSEKCRGRIHD